MRRGIQTILGGAILCLGVALGSRARADDRSQRALRQQSANGTCPRKARIRMIRRSAPTGRCGLPNRW